MGSIGFSFNAEDVDPTQREYALLPEGVYRVEVEEADTVSTKAGDGLMLKLTYRVIEGDREGAKVWSNLNVQNKSAKAQEIGQRDYSALCRAIGVMAPQEHEELLYKPITVKVGIEPGKDGYKDRNKITRIFYPGDGSSAEPPAMSTAAAPPTAPRDPPPPLDRPASVAAGRPWGRR
jgi:hypothetical protein